MTTATRPPSAPVRSPGLRPEDVLSAIALGAAAVVAWPLALYFQLPGPAPTATLVAHVTGMLAGYGVVVLIGLMSRAPALERGVGADRLARWHSRGGRSVVLLVLVHAGAAVQVWAQGESVWLAAWQVLRLPGLIAATVGTVAILAVAVLSIRAARRRVSYERWHAVHLLVYVGVALSFVHQLAGPEIAGHRVLQVVWALLYTQVFALVLRHRVLTPLRNAGRHRMRVAAVVPEAPGVVSVVIEGRNLSALEAQSGQFFRWRFLTPDLWLTAHPFSLSAAPTDTHLRLTVKTLGDGSARLQRLEPGTWVLAEGPYGSDDGRAPRPARRPADRRRCRDHPDARPVRDDSTAAGSGPAAALPCSPAGRPPLRGRIGPDRLAPWRPRPVPPWRPDRAVHSAAFLRLVPGLPHRDVYLCGPPGMADAVRRSLRQAGLPDTQLHEERFDF